MPSQGADHNFNKDLGGKGWDQNIADLYLQGLNGAERNNIINISWATEEIINWCELTCMREQHKMIYL